MMPSTALNVALYVALLVLPLARGSVLPLDRKHDTETTSIAESTSIPCTDIWDGNSEWSSASASDSAGVIGTPEPITVTVTVTAPASSLPSASANSTYLSSVSPSTSLTPPATKTSSSSSISPTSSINPIVALLQSNALAAQQQNLNFRDKPPVPGTSCDASVQSKACINGQLATCDVTAPGTSGTWFIQICPSPDQQCFAVPLLDGKSNGTQIDCFAKADAEARIKAAGTTTGLFGTGEDSTDNVSTGAAASTHGFALMPMTLTVFVFSLVLTGLLGV